ncbi:MAG: GNAT family N-acetyltransferase [Caldilineaceae bacterium]
MIEQIDHRDLRVAQEIYVVQQASYAVEQALIECADFPPLQVTPTDIQQEDEIFLGYRVGAQLAGVVSFASLPTLLDIGRLIVHPDYFRRGIASQLLQAVESFAEPAMRITVSTAEKNLPAVQLYLRHGYQQTEQTVLPDGLVLVRFYKTQPLAAIN